MNILVVAAHPDDEILGCGATIAKHIQLGDDVGVMLLSEGVSGRITKQRVSNSSEVKIIRKAAHTANLEILGVKELRMFELPDCRMSSYVLLDIVKMVDRVVHEFCPRVIYTHHIGDLNEDHQITHKAVITACRSLPNSSVEQIYFFEIPSSTEWQIPPSGKAFIPNRFVDITNTLSKTFEALEAYSSELRPYPHPRSIESIEYLARWRGSTIGVEAAEAFVVGRQIWR